ncbi:IMPACT family protein [Namhaeicola litoreus]|uniref:IMPACT family protein n=1 Tax=Namhaeicola litoreus TaxID=1052145 RepID=A0ABW3Y1T8_9FLAO
MSPLEQNDTFQTIAYPTVEVLFKDKGSKFYGYAIPVSHEDEIDVEIQKIKAIHHKARHYCYAYKIGGEPFVYRVNDDGEPSNSAGMPIYGQILSHNLTNVLVVVVRYFGGVKLGVGGLISAYRSAANMALESSEKVEKTIDDIIELKFDYADLNKVMKMIKDYQLSILKQDMQLSCVFLLEVRKSLTQEIIENFSDLRIGQIRMIE